MLTKAVLLFVRKFFSPLRYRHPDAQVRWHKACGRIPGTTELIARYRKPKSRSLDKSTNQKRDPLTQWYSCGKGYLSISIFILCAMSVFLLIETHLWHTFDFEYEPRAALA